MGCANVWDVLYKVCHGEMLLLGGCESQVENRDQFRQMRMWKDSQRVQAGVLSIGWTKCSKEDRLQWMLMLTSWEWLARQLP